MNSIKAQQSTIKSTNLTTRILYIFQILFNPKQVFLSIKSEKKLGFLPLFLLALIYFAINLAISNSLADSKELTKIFQNKSYESLKMLISILSAFIQTILFFINIIISSIVYKLILIIFKISIDLKNIIQIVFISQTPFILSTILKLKITDYSQLESFIPVSSLGYILSNFEFNQTIVTIFSKIELFNIWSIFLISLGISIFSEKKLQKILISLLIITITFNIIMSLI